MNKYEANEVLVDESGNSEGSNLLIEESPLLVLPTIATKLSLNEAIVLQQVHVSAEEEPLSMAGHNWVHKSYLEWQKQNFPFWSEKTISRIFKKLEQKSLIIAHKPQLHRFDQSKCYRINYERLENFLEEMEDWEMD
ncbi:hypothetical protein [Ureibacillus manganicus]|uniref:hypothetical protein n=1 Tax=Ureibacillus manganicus TaxID=1266064 RepID=UPI00068D9906|nr:hypothetical protein [Ureibacillus manganicus]